VGTYNISTYFWYFEARNNASTAPPSIYLSGGPGESSTYSALSSENGPCVANPDGISTTINPWSFNNYVNILYIDQPVQTGFSYDKLVNATYDLIDNVITPSDPEQLQGVSVNLTFGVGTYSSQDSLATTNNTVTSAKALWHFAENWLSSFPEYKTTSNKISLWTNSVGVENCGHKDRADS
jgi:Serine carboxypeptidase